MDITIDTFPKDSRGRHDYKILTAYSDSAKGEPVEKYCTKCGKSVDLTKSNETPFADQKIKKESHAKDDQQ